MCVKKMPGILVSFALAMLAFLLGQQFPLVGSSVLAIVLGILLKNSIGIKASWEPGLTYSGKYLLQLAIIVLGATFSIREVSEIGLSSLRLSLLTIAIAFIVAYSMGRYLKVPKNLAILIGFGTAICGGSAIAAASPVLNAEDEDIALSLSTIFLFNILAVFIFPFLGHVMAMSDLQFGLWAGTAINDTSSVVAASYSYSTVAGDYATIVKLARALMIVPSCVLMAMVRVYQSKQQQVKMSMVSIFPWFILWFLFASLLSSFGLFSPKIIVMAKKVSQCLMAMALVGIGSKVSLETFKKAGVKPFVLGLTTWVSIAISSLLLQYWFFNS